MRAVLPILDVLVLLYVVISVCRAVWNGPKRLPLLTCIIIAAMIIFGIVSFTAADGLVESSPLNQGALLIFLVAIAIVSRKSWKEAGPVVTSSAGQRPSSTDGSDAGIRIEQQGQKVLVIEQASGKVVAELEVEVPKLDEDAMVERVWQKFRARQDSQKA